FRQDGDRGTAGIRPAFQRRKQGLVRRPSDREAVLGLEGADRRDRVRSETAVGVAGIMAEPGEFGLDAGDERIGGLAPSPGAGLALALDEEGGDVLGIGARGSETERVAGIAR